MGPPIVVEGKRKMNGLGPGGRNELGGDVKRLGEMATGNRRKRKGKKKLRKKVERRRLYDRG